MYPVYLNGRLTVPFSDPNTPMTAFRNAFGHWIHLPTRHIGYYQVSDIAVGSNKFCNCTTIQDGQVINGVLYYATINGRITTVCLPGCESFTKSLL